MHYLYREIGGMDEEEVKAFTAQQFQIMFIGKPGEFCLEELRRNSFVDFALDEGLEGMDGMARALEVAKREGRRQMFLIIEAMLKAQAGNKRLQED